MYVGASCARETEQGGSMTIGKMEGRALYLVE